ncbi:hypothetical protein D3C76_1005190 [compost metagenome]
MSKIPTEIFRQLSEVFPLLARPVVEQLRTGLRDGFKGLFDHRVSRLIESA